MIHSTSRRWDRRTLAEPELPLLANCTDSSQAAAIAVAPHRDRQNQAVLNFLRSRGEAGATNEEVYLALDIKTQSETRAMNDLVRLRLARDSGRRHKSSSGINVIVWVAT